jgi:hypothetical protein
VRQDGTGLEYSLCVIGADNRERGLSSRVDGWTGSSRHLQDAASAGWRALIEGKADPTLDIAQVLVIGRFGYGPDMAEPVLRLRWAKTFFRKRDIIRAYPVPGPMQRGLPAVFLPKVSA